MPKKTPAAQASDIVDVYDYAGDALAAYDELDAEDLEFEEGDYVPLLSDEERRNKRLAELDYLLEEGDAPEITHLSAVLPELWAADQDLLALLSDPRWTQVEGTFSRGRAALALCADMGPYHAGAVRRFGRLAALSFGMCFSQDLSWSERPWQDDFFADVPRRLHLAAKAGMVIDFSSLESQRINEAQFQECLAIAAEGAGESLENLAVLKKRVERSLRALIDLIWSHLPVTRRAPEAFFYDLIYLPTGPQELNGAATVTALYEALANGQERITFSLPSICLAVLTQRHRLPRALGDFSLAELALWEPCILDCAYQNIAEIVTHELTHALSRGDEIIDETSCLWPIVQTWEPPRPEHLDRRGMSFGSSDNLNEEIGYLLGATWFNETLTEAAMLELYSTIKNVLPASLGFFSEDLWREVRMGEPIYRRGFDLLEAFLPGRSMVSVLTGESPINELAAGVRARLSPIGAARVLDLLLDFEKLFSDPIFLKEVRIDGNSYTTLFSTLRQIIAIDDATRPV